MTPRNDDYEQEQDSFSDDDDEDDNDGFNEDMAALARACMIAGPNNNTEDEIPAQKDPLLSAGDAIVPLPVAGDSDDDDDESDLECLKRVQSLYQSPDSILPPVNAASDDEEEEDDFETLRAIFNRFATYEKVEGGMKTFAEGDHASSLSGRQEIASSSISDKSNASEICPDSQYPDEDTNTNLLTEQCGFVESQQVENQQADACLFSKFPQKISSFPPSAKAFVGAINKNRALQKFYRSKLIEIEAKIEENKQLRNKVKLLKDFQVSCSRRTGSALSLKKDPRVQLISTNKSFVPNNSKAHKKASAMCYGPAENARVANYKMVLERFPLSLERKKWSNVERKKLSVGIKQQFQKMIHQHSVDRMSSECSFEDANDMDKIITSVTDLEITPERIKLFLPKVNWDLLVAGRTGAESESRWLNWEDPLINHGPWTGDEDRSLLIAVEEVGTRNWFDIADSLATNRTPFQCLARYQRSLNPSMLNSEWTEEEDAQLCSAVAYFGQSDWQSVASVLERRTGTQCSNRWKKSLCPVRKGSFTQEEDERLTVAVMLFGRKWNQIAKFVPGRIQSQCRDRYLNSLDPSLIWGGWTEEEDLRLEAAIAKYGYCWSMVAEDVSPRTDSQCRKRWKVLCPEQVPLLQEARKRQKSLLASNFVDRESERPALTLNDFIPLQMLPPPSDVGPPTLRRKRKRESRNVPKKERSKKCIEGIQGEAPKKERPRRHSKKASLCPEEVQYIEEYSDKVKTCEGVSFFALSSVHKKTRSKRHAKKARIYPEELNDIACSDKTCIESLESHSLENTTLASFLSSKSKKRLSKCTKNVRDASFYSETKVSPKQVENQIPSAEQDGLSLSCSTSGTKDLSIRKKVASCRRVRKPKGANSRKSEDTNNLTVDGDDMPLACFVRNKPKKWNKAEPTKTNVIEEETVVEDTNNLTVDGDDMTLACFVRNKSKKCSQVEPTKVDVVEEETVVHGVMAKAENIDNKVEEDDHSLLQNRASRRQRRVKIHKCSCCH